VAARDTTSQAEEEAHSPTPQEESGQTTARCAPVASTLELLEWDKLSAQVAGFAGTASAREMLRRDGLPLPQAREGSERLLAETREAWAIEQRLAKPLELRGFHDLTMPVSLAQKGGVLDGEQLAKLASSLATASTLSKQLRDATADSAASNDDSAQLGLLADLLNAVPLQAELRRELGAAIDEAGEVRDSASPTLGELRYAMREMATSTRRALGAIIAKKSDALATSQPVYRGERFLLQVIAKQKHRVKGTVRDVSGSGQTLYIEPREVEAANTKLRQLAKKEEALTLKVRKQLSARVGAQGTAEGLLRLQAAVTTIDLAAARARYAARLGATPVRFGEGAAVGGVELRQLRHPLLVWRDNGQAPNASAVVPMDFEVPSFVRAVVVTGPNTGGKTVSLKTLGMAALMAKAGLWLLCEGHQGDADGEVELPWFDRVMADIGDEQSIAQSLSTFSAHVARMKAIMEAATPDSLVLLDEVGAGTDPTEGSALGMSVLRRLAGSASLTMATTHHGRLKTLKTSDPRFENACVEFDDASLRPTYRLLWGVPGRSNALAIASRLGMPTDVIDGARELLGEQDADEHDVLVELQAQQVERRQLNAQLRDARDAAQRGAASLAEQQAAAAEVELQRRAAHEAELEAELAAARQEVRDLLRQAREASPQAQQASQRLAAMQREAGAAGGAAGAAAEAAAAAAAAAAPPSLEAMRASIEAGDLVEVPRLGEELLSVEARKKNGLSVSFGGLTMKVKVAEVSRVVGKEEQRQQQQAAAQQAAQKKRRKAQGGGGGKERVRTVVRFDTNTLDLRGMRAAEVGAKLGGAVDRASDLGTLWIIHGHGTGSLKQEVLTLLKQEPLVERWEDAPQKEGGSGCTLAYLK